MKKSILAGMLAAAFCGQAAAASYYVVVPLPARADASPIAVSLQQQALPAGVAGVRYPDFDFRSLLTVTGDANFNPAYVRWTVVSGALPAGLAINDAGVLTGTPSVDAETTFELKAYYKSKTGIQRYVLTIKERGSIATVLGGGVLDWGAIERADLPQVRSIALQNTGDRPMSLSAATAPGPFVLAGSSCVDVAPGATCSLVYRLADTPPGDYGPVTSTVTGASAGSAYIKLSARVLGPLVAAESGSAIDFQSVTVSDAPGAKVATWRNKGNTAMTLVAGAVPAPFSLVSNSCINVAPGATCQTTFTMSTSAVGTYSGAASFAGGGAPATVTLAGKVVTANLTASRASVAFGGVPVNTSVSNTVVLTNAGTVRAPVAFSTLAAPFSQTSTCQSVLEAGASCDVTITYRPVDLSAKADTLTVASLSIPVSGTGEKVAIETAGAGRRWQDGTYAASCRGYLTPGANYQYAGATGSGVYTVDPDGLGAQPAVDVYCDMASDGGGWMLVANYGRNGEVNTPLMNAGGDYNVARSPANPLRASGSIGVSRWSSAFGFSTARMEVVAGDDVNQVATFYKTVTYANLASWGAYAAVEPNATRTCTDLGLTQNCTTQPFDHNYQGSQSGILLMRGVNLLSYGYPASADMPVHGNIDGATGGFCSVTGNNNNNQWHDSYADGHWGNGLRIWLR
jgi:hypothetical protein